MKNIFISYSREDLETVEEEIIPEIERINGADCWFDFHEIEAGEFDFPQKIKDGIKECFIFLLIVSKSSIIKDWPLIEFEFANDYAVYDPMRHVVLVNIDGTELTGKFAPYKEFRDIIFWDIYRQHIKLVDNISVWINRQARSYFEDGKKNEFSDFTKAFQSYKRSAELGLAEAQSKIAYYYYKGKEGYLQSDLQEAIKWCSISTSQGYVGAISLRGTIEKSLGDTAAFIGHHQKAAENGWSYSQYMVGNAYYNGSLPRDIINAIYWLKKAADQCQPDAQKLLGEILLKQFKEGNKKLASEYLSKARKGFLDNIKNPDGDGAKKHAQDAIKKIEDLCQDYNIKL